MVTVGPKSGKYLCFSCAYLTYVNHYSGGDSLLKTPLPHLIYHEPPPELKHDTERWLRRGEGKICPRFWFRGSLVDECSVLNEWETQPRNGFVVCQVYQYLQSTV